MCSIKWAAAAVLFVCQLAHAQPVPEIYRYYAPLYGKQLLDYARDQGFNHPEEEKAVVAHELIHIAQAHHLGFYLGGTYVAPYLLDKVWTTAGLPLNREVLAVLPHGEKQGLIHRNYAGNTPENRLPNILDEINAYRLTAPWVCAKAPKDRCQKQITSLSGHLVLASQHLAYFRTSNPGAAERFRAGDAGRLTMQIMVLGAGTLKDIGGSLKDTIAEKEMKIWQ